MDKVIWKSMVAPNFKAEEPANNGPAASDGDGLGPITESDVENDVAALFGEGAETAEAPNPFGLTIDKPMPAGTSFDPTGELVTDPKAGPYYVPTIGEAINLSKEKEIDLNLKSYGGMEKIYKGKLTLSQQKQQKLFSQLESGGLSFNEADYIKQLLDSLDDSIKVIEDSLAMLPIMRDEYKQTVKDEYIKFKELAAPLVDKFNTGTMVEKAAIIQKLLVADINGDKKIGESLSMVETEIGTMLQDLETFKFVKRLSADGTPVTSKWFTNEPWNVFTAGVAFSNLHIAYEDAVFEMKNSVDTVESSTTLSAKIDMAVPDFATVLAKDGEAVTEFRGDDETHYVPAELKTGADGSITQEAQDDPEHYIQVRITKVDVLTYDDDSGDQRIRLLTADGIVAAEFRFTGRNGVKPATDYAIALNGKQRKESVVVDASQAVFTGTTAIDPEKLKAKYKEYGIEDEIPNSGLGKKNFEENMSVFQGYAGQAEEDTIQAGAFITEGLGGYIQGSKHGNNLFFLKDLTKSGATNTADDQGKKLDTETLCALSTNVVIGNGYHNVVFSKGSDDFYASDMAVAIRKSTNSSSINAVSAKGFITKDGEAVNAHNVIVLHGYGKKFVDNQSDAKTPKDGAAKPNNDDDWFDTGKEATYSVAEDVANPGTSDPDADSDIGGEGSLDGTFDANTMKTEGNAIEEAIGQLDDDEDDPITKLETGGYGGDFFNAMDKTQESFMTDFSNIFGVKNVEMDKWAEENPISTGKEEPEIIE